MILRAKTKNLFSGRELSERQQLNSKLNMEEMEQGRTILESYPRRLVFELTNACNLNCVMCGRNAADFKPTVFDMDAFMEKVKELAAKKSSVVIAVSEGVQIADGRFVCELGREVAVDAFGHKQMSGTAVILAQKVAEETGLKTRAIEFSTLQRAATHIASLTDINEAFQVGHDAVVAANEGKTGMMITLDRNGDDPYQCGTSAYDIHAIANVERKVPDEWITADGTDLTDDFEKYGRPLIMGELMPLYVNGTPRHLVRK